jgi:hypothetical protein
MSGITVQWPEGRDDESTNLQLADVGGSMATSNLMSEIPVDPDGKPRETSEDSYTPDIEIVRVTALNDLLARDDTIQIFMLHIWKCTGLLGPTMKVTTWEDQCEIETIDPKHKKSEPGVAVIVVAEKKPYSGIPE